MSYKRLTERDEFGNADIIGLSTEKLFSELCFSETNLLTKALNKLAFLETKLRMERLLSCLVRWGIRFIGYVVHQKEDISKKKLVGVYALIILVLKYIPMEQ